MEEERISIAFIIPKFRIGQAIYVPQKNKPVKATIIAYDAAIHKEHGKLLGEIFGYHIQKSVSVRRGDDSDFTNVICEADFYDDREKAREASKFLETKLGEEEWRIAIGDRDEEDENSPYRLENCNLPPCCGNISEARNILLYCKRNGGLIVHNRDELTGLLFDGGHGLKYDAQSPIGKMFEQLQIG